TAGTGLAAGFMLGAFQDNLYSVPFLCHCCLFYILLPWGQLHLLPILRKGYIFTPFALSSFTTLYNPFLLIVRIPSADNFNVIQVSSSARKKRLVIKLGRKRRFVLILECETRFPVIGFFPVT